MDTVPIPDTESSSLKNPWKHRIFFGVLFFVMIVFLWSLTQRKSVGTITLPQASIAMPDGKGTASERYEGKYFTFIYPHQFELRLPHTPVKWPMLEQALLVRTDVEGKKIAVHVQEMDNYSLEEYGSYRLRTLDTDTYTQEKIEKNGLDMTLFTKSTPVFEIGSFWQQGNKVISIVISSPLKITGLREELLILLDSLQVLTEE